MGGRTCGGKRTCTPTASCLGRTRASCGRTYRGLAGARAGMVCYGMARCGMVDGGRDSSNPNGIVHTVFRPPTFQQDAVFRSPTFQQQRAHCSPRCRCEGTTNCTGNTHTRTHSIGTHCIGNTHTRSIGTHATQPPPSTQADAQVRTHPLTYGAVEAPRTTCIRVHRSAPQLTSSLLERSSSRRVQTRSR